MKNKFLYLLILFGTFHMAQNHFELNEISKKYRVSIDIASCNEKECFGKTQIHLTDKNTSEKLPTVISENFTFNIVTDSLQSKNIQFEAESRPLIFDDFNFDNLEDLAVINKSSAGHFYDIYSLDSLQKQYLLNEGLTNLVKDNLTMFTPDSAKKTLTFHLKSGCCVQTVKEYKVISGRNPLKVYEFEEDTRDPEKVKTTKQDFIDYKWFTKITIYPKELYSKKNNNENTEGN